MQLLTIKLVGQIKYHVIRNSCNHGIIIAQYSILMSTEQEEGK